MQWWQPRARERAREVAVIACEYAQVVQQHPSRASLVSRKVACMQRLRSTHAFTQAAVVIACFTHVVVVIACLRTCSGSHRMLAHMQVVVTACSRTCSGGYRMLVLTNARACSGGDRVRTSVHVQWQSLRAGTRK
jgi:hypothetical protein